MIDENLNLPNKVEDIYGNVIYLDGEPLGRGGEGIDCRTKDKNIGNVSLHAYDFRGNNFTQQFVQEISADVDHSSIESIDLRDISDLQTPPEGASSKMIFGQTVKAKAISRESIIEQENQQLRQQLADILKGQEVAVLRSGLFAIGERAHELAEHILALDDLCTKIESGDFQLEQTSKPKKAVIKKKKSTEPKKTLAKKKTTKKKPKFLKRKV